MPELDIGYVFAGCRIEGVAGSGGMGVVYRANQLRPRRAVALKVIDPRLAADPEFRQRFQRESDTAASIDHPNVIPIYAADEHDGKLFICMRWVEGVDLGALIAERGRLTVAEAADIITQVAAGLDAAHARGLVHRDVKPANVLIDRSTSRPHAYLTDFGIARQAGEQTSAIGTLDYMGPERFEAGPIDARADVYSLGCVLYKMLTGEVPFPDTTQAAKIRAHLDTPPPSPSSRVPVPAALDGIVARAMAKDPAQRYPSAGALASDVTAAAGGTPVTQLARDQDAKLAPTVVRPQPPLRPPPRQPSPPSTRPRSNWLLRSALATAALVAAIAIASGAFTGSSNGPPQRSHPQSQPRSQPQPEPQSQDPQSQPQSQACTAISPDGATYSISIQTPNTVDCAQAKSVWTTYRGQLSGEYYPGKYSGTPPGSVSEWQCRSQASRDSCTRSSPVSEFHADLVGA